MASDVSRRHIGPIRLLDLPRRLRTFPTRIRKRLERKHQASPVTLARKALGHRTSPLPINIIREGFYPSRASPANRSESHHASLPKTNWKLGSLEAWMLGTCTMRTLAKDLSFVFPKSKTILLPGVRYSIFKTCHLVNGLPSGNAVAHPQ